MSETHSVVVYFSWFLHLVIRGKSYTYKIRLWGKNSTVYFFLGGRYFCSNPFSKMLVFPT